MLRSTPDGAADRLTLIDAAEAVGMAAATVSVYLSYHPAFITPAHNVWTTLGTEVPPDVVARLQHQARQRSRTEAREFRTGLDSHGRWWVSLSVTSNLRIAGVLLKRWLPTDTDSLRLEVTDRQGDPCGTVVFNNVSGFTHGLGTYIRRFDVQVGDILLLTADLERQTAQVTHGGPDLLSGPAFPRQ